MVKRYLRRRLVCVFAGSTLAVLYASSGYAVGMTKQGITACDRLAALPFDAGRELAASIPGARFVPLESRNHIILEQEPAWQRFRTEIKGFLKAPQ